MSVAALLFTPGIDRRWLLTENATRVSRQGFVPVSIWPPRDHRTCSSRPCDRSQCYYSFPNSSPSQGHSIDGDPNTSARAGLVFVAAARTNPLATECQPDQEPGCAFQSPREFLRRPPGRSSSQDGSRHGPGPTVAPPQKEFLRTRVRQASTGARGDAWKLQVYYRPRKLAPIAIRTLRNGQLGNYRILCRSYPYLSQAASLAQNTAPATL